jgi:hypothetical protein
MWRESRETMGERKSSFSGRMMACLKTVFGGRVLASADL